MLLPSSSFAQVAVEQAPITSKQSNTAQRLLLLGACLVAIAGWLFLLGKTAAVLVQNVL